MIRQLEFDAFAALKYAQEGRLEEWVHKYLRSGPWANPAFSEGLLRQPRWWNGPLEIDLLDLSPAVGPDPGMEFVVDPDYWNIRICSLARSFTEPERLPPLIVEYREGALSIRDGNTRYAAMQWLGWKRCWAIIWYNSESDQQEHTRALAFKDLVCA
jgi:hypothetical protein